MGICWTGYISLDHEKTRPAGLGKQASAQMIYASEVLPNDKSGEDPSPCKLEPMEAGTADLTAR